MTDIPRQTKEKIARAERCAKEATENLYSAYACRTFEAPLWASSVSSAIQKLNTALDMLKNIPL